MAAVRIQALSASLLAELRDRLARSEISQTSLAKRTCLSQPHISALLTGRRKLTIATADALMLGLGITTEELLTIALDKQPPPAPPPVATAHNSYGVRIGHGPRMHIFTGAL